MSSKSTRIPLTSCVIGLSLISSAASAERFWHRPPTWSPGELVIADGGCPIETPDALSLMFASGPARGGMGNIDIWVIDRSETGGPWGPPKNLPHPVNSAAADFCPSPFERSLFFVSTRTLTNGEACGSADIYLSRQSPAGDWSEPIHLPCAPDGPNTPGTERSPSLIKTWHGTFLFFSTNEGIDGADDDIYVSIMDEHGEFQPGHVVHALSTPNHQDQMPTVRARGYGYEVVFNSDRPGSRKYPAFGGQDVYYSRASFLPFWWTPPRNVGPNVNTLAHETRASLSVDGERLYVGRGDIYVSERQ